MVVSTRLEATKTEIIDVIKGEPCSNLPDFKAIIGPVYQGTHFQDTPVFCGNEQLPTPTDSFSYSFKCYKFKHNGGWQEFASLIGKRDMAAGIVYKNKFHVFGGFGRHSNLKTSVIVSENGVSEDGPDLKTAISSHAITIMNSTTSIITGGNTSIPDITSETWYYNHETQTFTSGPKLMVARSSHGSATIVDKTTKEKIPVVTGGYVDNKLFQVTDLTELLIKGKW